MPYFKDTAGGLHFLDDAAYTHLLPTGCVAITDAEADAIQNPPLTLGHAQATKLTQIEAAFIADAALPIAYMGTTFQADKDSRDLMAQAIIGLQAVVAVGGTVPANFTWWDSNNVAVPMTLLQLQGLFATGLATFNSKFANKQVKKAAVREASTVANVQSTIY
jgi:hypothetical protein